MLLSYYLCLFAAVEFSSAKVPARGIHKRSVQKRSPPIANHGKFPSNTNRPGNAKYRRTPIRQRQAPAPAPSSCGTGSQTTVKAPETNIFAGLSDQEAVDVTLFLHGQSDLNVTAAQDATPWDNKVLLVELLQPNKSDALSYLDSGSAAPVRYARAQLRFGATEEPYLQEYQVGPLPVKNGTTTVTELNYIYNKGKGYQRLYDVDAEAIANFTYAVSTEVADLTQLLINGTSLGADNDTIALAHNTPLIHEDGKIFQWNQYFSIHTGACADEDLLPSGFMFKADITGRDPTKWAAVAWVYNGIYYETEAALRAAVNSSSFAKPGPNVDGDWACTDYNNDPFPHDDLNPPVPVQPGDTRFALDEQEKYVEWMDFSLYFTSTRDLGLQLYNIKYKGERIIYELGLQEAVAHYASASDPFQGNNAYLDSEYGFGQTAFPMIKGFDCPTHATYLNTTYYSGETTHTHPNSLCLFEFDTGYPIQRHTTAAYVTISKNIAFTMRQVSTVGNYDYVFDYEFFLDGTIHVTVRASGYIESSFWTTTMSSADGFHIHDNLGGSLHDHVLNYKLDMDIGGTANSLIKSSLVPVSQTYPWSNGKVRNTMTLEKEFITSEDDSKLNWDANNAIMYSLVNKDAVNKYGEYRSYKIFPATGYRNSLTIQNSTTLSNSVNWATDHLYVVQHHDTEPHSAYPYNGRDPEVPVVDFAKFFNGESLDQEDIVMYFNLGMHHIPDQSDIPNTVFTNAQSSMIISPQNAFYGDPSRSTIHQTRVNFVNGSVTDALTFGTKSNAGCSVDLAVTEPDLKNYAGEVYISKYPYVPDAQMLANPGEGTDGGLP